MQNIDKNYAKLKFLIENCPSGYLQYVKNPEKYQIVDLVEWIKHETPLLNSIEYTWQTKIYWILNRISSFPKCSICGQPMVNCNVKSIQKGYVPHICNEKKCKNKHKAIRIQTKMQELYGYSNNYANPAFIEWNTKQHREKYGNACPANNKKIRDQIKKDNLEDYGVEFYSQTDECKSKVKETNLKNLGVEYPMQAESCKGKFKQTCMTTYGVDHPMKSEKVQAERKAKLISTYGENYAQDLYGNRHNYGQYRRSYFEYILKDSRTYPLFSFDEFVNKRISNDNSFEFKCKKCNKTFTANWDNGYITRKCPYCMNTGSSDEEAALHSYLLSLLPNDAIKHNDRNIISPLELDFFIEPKKIAIEFDGLYWHNDEMQPNPRYHLNKTLQCESNGIQLIHIFENEWIYKQDIVKSRIKNLLGIYNATTFARKCKVISLDADVAKEFLLENHIQGPINASLHYGLQHNNEIVALMSFGKARFSSKHEWELLRFCVKLGYHVPGAAGKLLKHFEKSDNPKSLVSYADRRWSIGNLYKKLGFTLDHISSPDYWYFNDYSSMVLKSRMQFQKHLLKSILKNFDETKTEVENMRANGYHRIFDCGNYVFVKKYS